MEDRSRNCMRGRASLSEGPSGKRGATRLSRERWGHDTDRAILLLARLARTVRLRSCRARDRSRGARGDRRPIDRSPSIHAWQIRRPGPTPMAENTTKTTRKTLSKFSSELSPASPEAAKFFLKATRTSQELFFKKRSRSIDGSPPGCIAWIFFSNGGGSEGDD